ncbi:MAG: hypothetical protein CR217_12890 [Beijerinckiaceae bacterium]|nr:MAG: hypothetical protein CR217_12890 [Beijerinckiaceae bacterium]
MQLLRTPPFDPLGQLVIDNGLSASLTTECGETKAKTDWRRENGRVPLSSHTPRLRSRRRGGGQGPLGGRSAVAQAAQARQFAKIIFNAC